MSATKTINADLLRTTTCELLDIRGPGVVQVEQLGRDARIEKGDAGTDCLVMDDAGYGEFSRAMGPTETAEIIRSGLARDAR